MHYIYIICIYNVKKLRCTLDIYAYVTYKCIYVYCKYK